MGLVKYSSSRRCNVVTNKENRKFKRANVNENTGANNDTVLSS